MAAKQNSRGPNIDTQQCVENVGNRFDLVLIAAARSKEIARRHRRSESKEFIYPPLTALLEIQAKQVGCDYLKKV